MLQIASGKLFRIDAFRTNALRGVVYSNLFLHGEHHIATVAGKLLGVNSHRRPCSLVYEFDERMEGDVIASGVIASHGLNPYLQDFAAIASFFLKLTFSADIDLVKRLTSGERGLATKTAPNKLIKQVFDQEVFVPDTEAAAFTAFVVKLIGLKRTTYLEVMRAIRTFVTGMHRLGDDLELAYTLLVAAGEALAQKTDGHQAVWEDYDEAKRQRIDQALTSVESEAAEKVRAAVLENEHVAIRRRFVAFILANIPDSYFREDSVGLVLPVGRQDLKDGLEQAYLVRSRYVHRLVELSDQLTRDTGFSESVLVDEATVLTFQGLSRAIRTAIVTFVMRQETLTREPYDYSLERSGVVRGRWAAIHWMSNLDAVQPEAGREWLDGFLEQLAAYWHNPESTNFSDLRSAMDRLEPLLANMGAKSRLAYLTVYFAYNIGSPPERRCASGDKVAAKYLSLFNPLSIESMVLHTVVEQVPDWPLDAHAALLDQHLSLRSKKSGRRYPRILDAAMSLDLAERYRLAGNHEGVKGRLKATSENFPQIPALREVEASYDAASPIVWRMALLKRRALAAVADVANESEANAEGPNV